MSWLHSSWPKLESESYDVAGERQSDDVEGEVVSEPWMDFCLDDLEGIVGFDRGVSSYSYDPV